MTAAKYTREREMYPDVMEWLERKLRGTFPHAEIKTYDTSAVALYRFLETNGFQAHFPQYQSYDIHVDVTGIVRIKKEAHLAFVECKLNQITLRDFSQLLGYSRVAAPIYSIIISPAGIGSSMTWLLKTYGRLDVLEYGKNRRLRVAAWDSTRREVSVPTVIPTGDFL